MPEQALNMEAEKEKLDSIANSAAGAVMSQDFETMDKLFAENFTIYRQGMTMTLAEFKTSLQERVSNYTGELTKDRILISDDGTLAIYNTREDFEVMVDGKKSSVSMAYMTMVFTKNEDSWEVAHVCRTVPMPPMPEKMEIDTMKTSEKELM